MGWCVYLLGDHDEEEGYWSGTHNINGMIEAVMDAEEIDSTEQPFWAAMGSTAMGRGSWWNMLDGKTGPQGAAFLDGIVRRLQADPERFRAMNPPNGFGNYDELVQRLISMRDAVPEWPTIWSCNG